MIILTNVGGSAPDTIELVTSAAALIDTHASWSDLTAGAVTLGRTNIVGINSATTTVNVVPTPASGAVRKVKALTIRNRHATLACDVTVQYDQNATNVELFKTTLAAGQTLEYLEGLGFFVPSVVSKLFKNLRVASDVINATTSFADITGLTWAVESGKQYGFAAVLHHIENANTTGARFAINGPAMTAMRVGGVGVYTGSLTAAVVHSQVGDITALDTAVPGATTASTTTPQVAPFYMQGWFNPSANGTFAVRSQSEVAVAAGLTIKAGSFCQLWEFDN